MVSLSLSHFRGTRFNLPSYKMHRSTDHIGPFIKINGFKNVLRGYTMLPNICSTIISVQQEMHPMIPMCSPPSTLISVISGIESTQKILVCCTISYWIENASLTLRTLSPDVFKLLLMVNKNIPSPLVFLRILFMVIILQSIPNLVLYKYQLTLSY